jgi:hypothetical protein
MKLFELKTKQSQDEYLKFLADKQIKALKNGRGTFGDVFQHPTMSDIVVKVFTERDHAYREWYHFCSQNKSNPFVPKFFGNIRDFEFFNSDEDEYDDYSIVFMEKLRAMNHKQFNKFWNDVCGPELSRKLTSGTFNFESTWFDSDEALRDLETIMDANVIKDDNLFAVIDMIRGSNRLIDLKPDNLMLRGNQIVFTDPIAMEYDVWK